METARGVLGTGKGLTADKIACASKELAIFTGLKIFTAQSKGGLGEEGYVSLGVKTQDPHGMQGPWAGWLPGSHRTVVAGQGTQGAGLVSLQQTRTLASTQLGNAGWVGGSAPWASDGQQLCPVVPVIGWGEAMG